MGICYSLWKLPGREVGTHIHLLACKVESSVGGKGTRQQRQPVPAAVPTCELFFVGLENVWIRAPERGGKKKKKKAGFWRFSKYEKRGKPQINPKCGQDRCTKKSKKVPRTRLATGAGCLQSPCCSGPAGVPSSEARFLSYFVGFLDPSGTRRKERKRGKKAIKNKTKMQGAAFGEPVKRRVRVPLDAVSSCQPSSPVGRCERGEQRERCEDARRWNNEFIAACHPAMAISTIRHCKLPLKGRASPTTPTLPGPRLIRRGRAGQGGDRGKGDREGGRDTARWKEGRRREQGRGRGKVFE